MFVSIPCSPQPSSSQVNKLIRSSAFKFDRNGVDCKVGGGSVVLASHGYVYAPGGQ